MYYVNVLCLFSSVWFGAGAKVEPEVKFPLHKTPIPAPDLSLIGLISISKVPSIGKPSHGKSDEGKGTKLPYLHNF